MFTIKTLYNKIDNNKTLFVFVLFKQKEVGSLAYQNKIIYIYLSYQQTKELKITSMMEKHVQC